MQTLLTLAQEVLTLLMLVMQVGKLAFDAFRNQLDLTAPAMHAHEKIQLTELLSYAGVSPMEADYISSCLATVTALVAGILAACDHEISPRRLLVALHERFNAWLPTITGDGLPRVPRVNSRTRSWLFTSSHNGEMTSSGSQREWHPFANLFPLMSHEDLHGLSKSIQAHGLRVPVLLDRDGRVLDGRNRLMACAAAGVAPTFEVWEGDDSSALQHVVDINLQRRHLDEGQRALVAARLANVSHGGARRGQAAHAPLEAVTQRQAAARLAVSERTVRDGKLVLDHAPDEMRVAVEDGLLAVRTAAELIRAAGRDRALAAEYLRLRRSSQSQEWYTPRHLLTLVEDVFGAPIDLDPASNSHTDPWVPARKHYTADDDGLSLPWHGRVFLNPPFSAGPRAWVEKLRDSHVAGDVPEAVALLPARTNTVWMRTLASYPRCFITGRLKYSDGPGFAPFPSVAVYLGPNVDRFGDVFTPVGDVYVPWAPQQHT